MKTALVAIFSCVAIAIVLALGIAFSGVYDVSATVQDSPAVAWFLEITRDRSVEVRADAIRAPPGFANPQSVRAGALRYRHDCQPCHGAPGDFPGPIGKGLNPQPPKLFMRDPDQPSPGEYYWVIMHGIRMTDMPSWQHLYQPPDVWAVVAFLEEFPKLSAEGYKELSTEQR